MYCNSCGNKLADGAEFCTNCGAKQGNTGSQTENTQRKVNIPPPQRTERSSTQGAYSEVQVMSVKDYILMMIVFAIPIVGFVFMFIWGFGSETPINKKNFARAFLIMAAIGVVLSILLSVVMGAITASMMSNLYY